MKMPLLTETVGEVLDEEGADPAESVGGLGGVGPLQPPLAHRRAGAFQVPHRSPVGLLAPRALPRVVHEINIEDGTVLETEHDPPICTDSKRPVSGPGTHAEWLGPHHPEQTGGLAGGVEKLQGLADPAEMPLGQLAAVLSLEQAC